MFSNSFLQRQNKYFEILILGNLHYTYSYGLSFLWFHSYIQFNAFY
jgi:hypothetical protein